MNPPPPAEPASSQAPQPAISSAVSPADRNELYTSLRSYDFDADSEYLSGLASILGHPETAPSAEELNSNPELILKVRCFYFARKHNFPPIDPDDYLRWLNRGSGAPDGDRQQEEVAKSHNLQDTPAVAPAAASPAADTNTIPAQDAAAASDQQQPPYPTSFAAIVDLITRNVPVPGIETIPDTVLDHGSSKVDHTPRRKKPWESDGDDTAEVAGGGSVGGLGALSTPTAALYTSGGATSAAAAGSEVAAVPTEELHRNNGSMQAAARAGDEQADTDTVINGHLTTGEGVVKILQPNAIPDSGLLAKD